MNIEINKRYRLVRLIAKGGMGEVYRAYDNLVRREVALKQIRSDVNQYPAYKKKFLREARLTARLSHPAIVPIYEIFNRGEVCYYTMPYIDGVNLKEYVRQIRVRGEDLHPIVAARIFMSLVQAMQHAHSRSILHRDLKAENVMIGQHDEAFILDWGLAVATNTVEPESPKESDAVRYQGMTRPGKVAGTLSYLAPERLHGPATEQSDIYSLGALLYFLLCYRMPFKRQSLSEFRENNHKEVWVDPRVRVPYKDIPEPLAQIAWKCMRPDPQERFGSMEELLEEVRRFTEGRSHWSLAHRIEIKKSSDWEFQQHVFIGHALIRSDIESQAAFPLWGTLMISEVALPKNIRLVVEVCADAEAEGIGVLINVPEEQERAHPLEGFCIWIAVEGKGVSCLCRDGVLVMELPHLTIDSNKVAKLEIEQVESRISLILDSEMKVNYVNYLPVIGAHVGILIGKGKTQLSPLHIYTGASSLKVSCLAIPDAFLAHRYYAKAYREYRRIAHCFAGYREARVALFRMGVTLGELAKQTRDDAKKEQYFSEAFRAFESLNDTPEAPYEWLGKALIYRAQEEYEEECNCLELGCRRYRDREEVEALHEEAAFRLHSLAFSNRLLAYRWLLLMSRSAQNLLVRGDVQRTIQSIYQATGTLPYKRSEMQYRTDLEPHEVAAWIGLDMTFLLDQPIALYDSAESYLEQYGNDRDFIFSVWGGLILMGCSDLTHSWLEVAQRCDPACAMLSALRREEYHEVGRILPQLAFSTRVLVRNVLGWRAVFDCRWDLLHTLQTLAETEDERRLFQAHRIYQALWEKELDKASYYLSKYPEETKKNPQSPAFFLQGCYFFARKHNKEAKAWFATVDALTLMPETSLLGAYLTGRIRYLKVWGAQAHVWQRRQLWLQLRLYEHIVGAGIDCQAIIAS